MRFERLHLKDFATLAVGAFGFLAAYYAPTSYVTSAFFIILAIIFDFLDGRIARHTGKHNEFGRELDSLSDAVAFGAAPALAVLFSVKSGFIWLYAACAVVYLSAVLIRLARFNLYAHEGKFYGLPSPAAALLLLLFAPLFSAFSPVVFLALAFLMLGEFELKKP